MIQRIEIDKDKPLEPGDLIELHFRSVGGTWLTAAQIALIDWQLEGRSDFRIKSWSIPVPQVVIFEIEVKKTNPLIVTAAVIAGAIIAAGVVAWLTLDKVYQIMESPAGQVGVAGFGVLAAVAAVAVVLSLLPKK